MANCYNQQKITKTFGVGEHVSVRVPQIDRTSSDLPRLPCMIVQVKGKVNLSYCLIISDVTGFFFKLRCEYGAIKSCYPYSGVI